MSRINKAALARTRRTRPEPSCRPFAVGKLLYSKSKGQPDAVNFHIQARHPLNGANFRRIALALPEATEGSHFGQADFRVGGKIFATLALESKGYGVLLLSPEQQAGMVEDEPEIFSPVPGGWGRKGSTRVLLAKVASDILEAALRTAWLRKAPKRLLPRTSKF
jgi:hypothetical protein